jgi:hypothetical protein
MAILCNADDAIPSNYAHALAERYFPTAKPAATPYTSTPPQRLAGIYASERDGVPLRLSLHGDRLQTDTGLALRAGANNTLALERANGVIAMTGAVLADGRLRFDAEGDATFYDREPAYAPTPADLARMAGRFHNDDVPVTYRITAEGDGLRVTTEDRPGRSRLFRPAYAGAFISGDVLLRPLLDHQGRITGMRISDDRVWNLPFERLP